MNLAKDNDGLFDGVSFHIVGDAAISEARRAIKAHDKGHLSASEFIDLIRALFKDSSDLSNRA